MTSSGALVCRTSGFVAARVIDPECGVCSGAVPGVGRRP